MKIIKLQSANFKRLKAIEIVPKGNTVIVSGKNGQGKSSILDSIFVALAGKDKDLLKPIREGETKAEILVETETFFIKRVFKQGRTELEVISKDGEIMSKPQTFLDGLVGKLSFDPLEFSALKGPEQRELLLRLAGLKLGEFDKKRRDAYEERHEIGTLMKAYPSKSFEDLAAAEATVGRGKIDVEALGKKAWAARSQKAKFMLAQERMKERMVRMEDIDQKIVELKDEWMKVKNEYDEANLVEDCVDIASLEQAEASATHNNAAVDRAALVLEEQKKFKQLDSAYEKYTAKIEEIDTEKDRALQSAKMPIAGLSVTDDAVTYNKIPFHQLSSAEKLKVSLSIAMAMNPELRVIRIMDGSLLDEDNMKVIQDMAKDQDYQVWVEVVDSTGKVGFYIEDGEVVATNS